MDIVESLRSKFKKVDNDCWLAQSVDLSNRDELYYQPFNGCAVFVRPDYLPSNNLAEVSISLRPLDEDESYRGSGIYWVRHIHKQEVWKLAKTAVDLLNTYYYPCGKYDLDIDNLDIALQGLGFYN